MQNDYWIFLHTPKTTRSSLIEDKKNIGNKKKEETNLIPIENKVCWYTKGSIGRYLK